MILCYYCLHTISLSLPTPIPSPPPSPAPSALPRIPPHPLPRLLLPPRPIRLKLLGNLALDRIVRVRLAEQLPREFEHGGDLRRRLPGLGFQHAETHGAGAVVADVGVIDFGGKVDGRRFEGVFGGQGKEEGECAALVGREGGLVDM